MKGIVALQGGISKKPWADRVQKKKRRPTIRKCFMCGKVLLHRNGNAIYCGSDRKKTGCSYKAKQLSSVRWKRKVKYWTWASRRAKGRIYERNYYKRIKKIK